MTCKCIDETNDLLRAHNTRLALTISFGREALAYPTILTEQIETGRGKKKAIAIMPTYCPFCGKACRKQTVLAA